MRLVQFSFRNTKLVLRNFQRPNPLANYEEFIKIDILLNFYQVFESFLWLIHVNEAHYTHLQGKCLYILCMCMRTVVQLCPALYKPMGCSLPGSSVHGIFQARILKWAAISISRGSSQSRDRTRVSCVCLLPLSPALQADSLLPSHGESPKNGLTRHRIVCSPQHTWGPTFHV